MKNKKIIYSLFIFTGVLLGQTYSDNLFANSSVTRDIQITEKSVDVKKLKLQPTATNIQIKDLSADKNKFNEVRNSRKQFKELLKDLEDLSNSGNTYAMNYLAIEVYSRDKLTAKHTYPLLKKSAILGNHEAALMLSRLFTSGRIYSLYFKVNLDNSLALKYALDGAFTGNSALQDRVSIMQLVGFAGDESVDGALEWAKISKQNGSSWGAIFINNLESNQKIIFSKLIEITKNYSSDYEFSLAEKIAKFILKYGDSESKSEASLELANINLRFNNYPKAIEWYKESANAGNAGAMLHLGNIYSKLHKTYGVNFDAGVASEWYLRCSKSSTASDYQRESSTRNLRELEWEIEKRKILNSSKSFKVEVICTDDVYISPSTGYASRGDGYGVSAVSAYYSMGAHINPNAYAAFSKTPYICKSQSRMFDVNRLAVIGRAPGGRYVVKIDGKNIYSAIK